MLPTVRRMLVEDAKHDTIVETVRLHITFRGDFSVPGRWDSQQDVDSYGS